MELCHNEDLWLLIVYQPASLCKSWMLPCYHFLGWLQPPCSITATIVPNHASRYPLWTSWCHRLLHGTRINWIVHLWHQVDWYEFYSLDMTVLEIFICFDASGLDFFSVNSTLISTFLYCIFTNLYLVLILWAAHSCFSVGCHQNRNIQTNK